jgi:hypothetical protein
MRLIRLYRRLVSAQLRILCCYPFGFARRRCEVIGCRWRDWSWRQR